MFEIDERNFSNLNPNLKVPITLPTQLLFCLKGSSALNTESEKLPVTDSFEMKKSVWRKGGFLSMTVASYETTAFQMVNFLKKEENKCPIFR